MSPRRLKPPRYAIRARCLNPVDVYGLLPWSDVNDAVDDDGRSASGTIRMRKASLRTIPITIDEKRY